MIWLTASVAAEEPDCARGISLRTDSAVISPLMSSLRNLPLLASGMGCSNLIRDG
jgi:hypothetical protein